MSTFQVLIKGRKEFIDFNGICTNIDYSNTMQFPIAKVMIKCVYLNTLRVIKRKKC